MTSIDGSASGLIYPPRYTKWCACLYAWPATSTRNVTAASSIPLVHNHIISVFASETVRPNAADMVTITTIMFLSYSSYCETTVASSAYGMSHRDFAEAGSLAVAIPGYPAPVFFLRPTRESITSLFASKRVKAKYIITMTKMLSRQGISTDFFTGNQPEHSPSSSHTHAHMLSQN